MTPASHHAATARHAYQIAILAADLAAYHHRNVIRGNWDRAPVSIEPGLYWSEAAALAVTNREKCCG